MRPSPRHLPPDTRSCGRHTNSVRAGRPAGYPPGVMTEPRNPGAGAVLEVDPLAIELGERFATAGHQLYLVGGAVRDLVLGGGTPGADVDFATDASPHQTTKLLRG